MRLLSFVIRESPERTPTWGWTFGYGQITQQAAEAHCRDCGTSHQLRLDGNDFVCSDLNSCRIRRTKFYD